MTKIGVDYETERVNFNISKKLMDRVREYAREESVPITYALQLLLKKGLDTDNSLNAVVQFNQFVDELKNGKFDKYLDKTN